MNDQQHQNEAACGGSALTAELAGKPEPLQFVIAQANVAMRTLVDYESQYKSSSPKEIQNRILAMADFIKARLDEYAHNAQVQEPGVALSARSPGTES